ncbi:MAG: prepilin-type N-terminal cleavage/methylation domain-containing protein [Oscillospiraceae bacterium]
MNFKKKIAVQSGGFTLVELIVVLAILGILAVIFVPNYIHYVNYSRQETCIYNREVLAQQYLVAMVDNASAAKKAGKSPADISAAEKILSDAAASLSLTGDAKNGFGGICPSHGLCTVRINDDYSCTIICDKHGSSTSEGGKTTLETAMEIIDRLIKKGNTSTVLIEKYFAENGNKFETVDNALIRKLYGDQELYQVGTKPLYWRPSTLTVAGKTSYVMFANIETTNVQGNWNGFVLYYNGKTYKSTESAKNGDADRAGVAFGNDNFKNSAAVEAWLAENHWQAVP